MVALKVRQTSEGFKKGRKVTEEEGDLSGR